MNPLHTNIHSIVIAANPIPAAQQRHIPNYRCVRISLKRTPHWVRHRLAPPACSHLHLRRRNFPDFHLRYNLIPQSIAVTSLIHSGCLAPQYVLPGSPHSALFRSRRLQTSLAILQLVFSSSGAASHSSSPSSYSYFPSQVSRLPEQPT